MKQTIAELSIILAHKDVLTNDTQIRVYIILCALCEKGSWLVNYKVISKLTGLATKKISLAIKAMENLGLFDINRSLVKGRIVIQMNELPDAYVKKELSIHAELKYIDKIKESNSTCILSSKEILDM